MISLGSTGAARLACERNDPREQSWFSEGGSEGSPEDRNGTRGGGASGPVGEVREVGRKKQPLSSEGGRG